MLLDIVTVEAKDYSDLRIQDFVRQGYHLKQILPPPHESSYYRFILVRPILPKKEWELDDS